MFKFYLAVSLTIKKLTGRPSTKETTAFHLSQCPACELLVSTVERAILIEGRGGLTAIHIPLTPYLWRHVFL